MFMVCFVHWFCLISSLFCNLEIKFELEVSLIKLVNSDITILTTTSIAASIRVKLYGVDGAKVS